jgi:post-segregation antitoxin (ccd killing protein)
VETSDVSDRLRVELELDRAVVAQARHGGRDLSRLVERLLREHVARDVRQDRDRRAHAEEHVAASNAVIGKHGL